jgi:multiple sugar transport system ATP-binding protein
MNVEQNLRFGLENQRLSKREIASRVERAAEILRIEQLLARRPNQLSGGQSQRVAIGRAIVKEPKAFLFDEPLSNLDAELRVKMRGELISLHQRLGATMIYVTHDQVEAMTMADRIVVLNDGRIEQAGSPVELYACPRNRFVAGFLGAPPMNVLSGEVEDGAVRLTDGTLVPIGGRKLPLPHGTPVVLGIRPEHIEVGSGPLRVHVTTTEVLGPETIVHAVTAGSQEALALTLRGISGLKAGDEVVVGFPPPFMHFFDERGTSVGSNENWRAAYLS